MRRHLTENEIRDLYDRQAFSYDPWSILTESRAHEEVLSLAGISPGETILEVGAGTGCLFREIAAANPTGLNVGIDISNGMLARAAAKMPELATQGLLQIGSAYALPYQDGCFDAVAGAYILDIIPDESLVAVLGEWHRVSKGDGRLVLVDMTRGAYWYNRFWGLLYDLHPKLMGGCRPVNAEPYLREAGWEMVERRELSQFTFASEVILARPAG
jgi:ubiquinone/menaquinone biosynthesis C-methylase UbiE